MKKLAKRILRRSKNWSPTETLQNLSVPGSIVPSRETSPSRFEESEVSTAGGGANPSGLSVDHDDTPRPNAAPGEVKEGTAETSGHSVALSHIEGSGSHQMILSGATHIASIGPDPADLKIDHESSPASSLWENAYQKVQDDVEFAPYLKAFKEHINKEASCDDTTIGEISHASGLQSGTTADVQTWVKAKLDALSESHLKLAIGDKQILVRQKLESSITFVQRHKAMITAAVELEPTAALAWGGIMAILSLVVNVFEQSKDAIEGFDQVCRLLVTGQLVEDTLSGITAGSTIRQRVIETTRESLVLLYAQVYRYQVRIFLYLNRHKSVRIGRDALVLDDWSSELKEAEKAADNVERGATQLAVNDIAKVHAIFRELREKAEKDKYDRDLERLNQLPFVGDALFDSRVVMATGKCLEGTHEGPMDTIKTWINNPDGELIYWLKGLPGTGKSTIALTMAAFLDQAPFGVGLGASFFFSRGDDNRNSGRRFLSTIAWCLGRRIPQLRPHIARAILENSNIPNESNESQLQNLILKPLERLQTQSSSSVQLLIVIDALDECHAADAEQVVRLLGTLRYLTQVRIRVLLTSRSGTFVDDLRIWNEMGDGIHKAVRLDKICLAQVQNKFVLASDPTTHVADDDITHFMTRSLSDIAIRHQFPDGWVNEERFLELRKRTEGLFIYASVACKFFDRPYEEPSDLDLRWNDILYQDCGPEENTPEYHLVNQVYTNVILSYCRSKKGRERAAAEERARRILGTMAVLIKPVTVATLAELLQMPTADLARQLRPFGSLVNVPLNDEPLPLSFVHPTLREYLLNGRLCPPEVLVNQSLIHLSVLKDGCLPIMQRLLHQNLCRLEHPGIFISEIRAGVVEESISESLSYSCIYWFDHLKNISNEQLAEALTRHGDVHQFLQTKLLFWFEALALIRRMDVPNTSLDSLLRLVETSKTENQGLQALVRDALYFVRQNRIAEHAPLQIYCSGLAFRPPNTPVFTHSMHLVPDWLERATSNLPGFEASVDRGANSVVYTLQCHLESTDHDLEILRYSKHGTTVVSGTSQELAIWDTVSGTLKYKFDATKWFNSVCVSPDGTMIAFVDSYSTNAICVHDLQRNCRYEMTTAKPGSIHDMVFLEDSRHMVCVFRECPVDQTSLKEQVLGCLLWDTRKHTLIATFPPIQGHDLVSPLHVAFPGQLKDGAHFLTWTREGLVRLWDVQTGRLVHNFMIQLPEDTETQIPYLNILHLGISAGGTQLWVIADRISEDDEDDTLFYIWRWKDWDRGCIDVPQELQESVLAIKAEFRHTSCTLHIDALNDSRFIIAVGNTRGEIDLWRFVDNHVVDYASFISHIGQAGPLEFSGDAQLLASASDSDDGVIHLLDVEQLFSSTGKEKKPSIVEESSEGSTGSARFMKGSDRLVTIDYAFKPYKPLNPRMSYHQHAITLDLSNNILESNIFDTPQHHHLVGMSVIRMGMIPTSQIAIAIHGKAPDLVPSNVNNHDSSDTDVDHQHGDSRDEDPSDDDSDSTDEDSVLDGDGLTKTFLDTISVERQANELPSLDRVLLVRFNGSGSIFAFVMLDPDGRYEVSVIHTQRLQIICKIIMNDVTVSSDHGSRVRITISSNGKLLAWEDDKFNIHLWDIEQNEERHCITPGNFSHKHYNRVLAFFPDGSILTTTENDRGTHTCLAIDTMTGKYMSYLRIQEYIEAFRDQDFSPDSRVAALRTSGIGGVLVWDPRKQESDDGSATQEFLNADLVRYDTDCKFSPDSQLIAIYLGVQWRQRSSRWAQVAIWDVSSTTKLWQVELQSPIQKPLVLVDFSTTSDRIDTNIGRLPWSRRHSSPPVNQQYQVVASGGEHQEREDDLRDCLYIQGDWLLQGNGYRLIWIPPAFLRGSSYATALKDGRVFLMNWLGDMATFKVHISRTPKYPTDGGRSERTYDATALGNSDVSNKQDS